MTIKSSGDYSRDGTWYLGHPKSAFPRRGRSSLALNKLVFSLRWWLFCCEVFGFRISEVSSKRLSAPSCVCKHTSWYSYKHTWVSVWLSAPQYVYTQIVPCVCTCLSVSVFEPCVCTQPFSGFISQCSCVLEHTLPFASPSIQPHGWHLYLLSYLICNQMFTKWCYYPVCG